MEDEWIVVESRQMTGLVGFIESKPLFGIQDGYEKSAGQPETFSQRSVSPILRFIFRGNVIHLPLRAYASQWEHFLHTLNEMLNASKQNGGTLTS